MQAMTYTEARQSLASTMDQVCHNHEAVIVTKKRDCSVVMISLDDYNAMEETAYLLRSPTNAVRLASALENARNGNLIIKTLAELEDKSA